MTATEGIVQILVLLLFLVLVSCVVGISCNDVNLEVIHLSKHCSEEFSNSKQANSLSLVVEMAYTAPQSQKTRSGFQLPFFGVIDATCCGPQRGPQLDQGRCLPQRMQRIPDQQRVAQQIARAIP